MKTLSFDLKKALAGHPVVTRDGRKVIQMAYFAAAPHKGFRLQALVEGEQYPLCYYDDGTKYEGTEMEEYDLFLEVKTVKRWARVLRKKHTLDRPFIDMYDFKTCEEAEEKRPSNDFDINRYEVLPAYEYEE